MEFDGNSFPADFDSTYEFVDRYDKLVKKATAVPAIVDFALQSMDGADTTVAILNQPNFYVMLLVNDFSNSEEWHNEYFDTLSAKLAAKHLPFYIVTSDKEKAVQLFGSNKNVSILLCDGIVIKTAARVNPTYFIMQLANIKAKYSYLDMDAILHTIDTLPENKDYDPAYFITDSLP